MSRRYTIVQIVSHDYRPAQADLDKWRQIFAEKSMTEEEAMATGEVVITHATIPEDSQFITFIKLGDNDYHIGMNELESWRNLFNDVANGEDYIIFTGIPILIETVNVGEIIAVE